MKDKKFTPRIAETAKALWTIYVFLTLFCCVGYWVAGMELFDALAHAFTTVSIGVCQLMMKVLAFSTASN